MDILQLSSSVIDSGIANEPVNRVTNQLSELADGLSIVESFSHTITVDTGDGLVCFDASGEGSGANVVAAIRGWSDQPFSTLVYTHGHADHIGGSGAFAADVEARGSQSLAVVGHENVARRIDRYRQTSRWNVTINQRQFGGPPAKLGLTLGDDVADFLPDSVISPTVTFANHLELTVGDTRLELHHGRGETDDHLWAFFPDKKWIATGDFIIWNYPNAGNPQKVQRYALEWAQSLRKMIAQEPELLLPAHGLPIEGKDRIAKVLDETASTLEALVSEVVALMNAGATLDTILHTVKVPSETLEKPYLRPYYDEPEFVIRNIWRLYGGWYDGAPSRLKPAPDAVVAAELATLAGGATVLMSRALTLLESDLRLACHLADLAVWAEPENRDLHESRAEVYRARRRQESSIMAQGIYRSTEAESLRAAAELQGGAH
jgi:alkyl sulfatase BDS1-like metallo-beta-lactamase superfamily hydrolase